MTQTIRKKVLGVGPVQCALKHFEQFSRDFEVHMVERGPRQPVKEEILRLCQTEGPFSAAFMFFANGSYGPHNEDIWGPLWQHGNNVGCFGLCGTGYNNVRVEDFTSHQSFVTNTPDAVTASTADFTVYLFLAALRGSTYCEDVAKQGLWHQGLELTTDPAGLTMGVLGMGRIGKDFVRKVRAFGVNTIYNTRTQLADDVEAELGLRYTTKDELFELADIIVVLTPSTKETYHMIDREQFAKMKDGVFIVNSSRGEVMNTDALIGALQSNKVKRAALDVFEKEPAIPEYLLNSPRVTCTPHVAAYTTGTIERGEIDVMNNIRAFLETGTPQTPVNGPF